jgi:hypothetical protein
LTADANRWIKIYKISGNYDTSFSKVQELNTIVTVKPLPYTNKVFIATTQQVFIKTSDALNCFSQCKSCNGITPFSCLSCYPTYLRTCNFIFFIKKLTFDLAANFCEKQCPNPAPPAQPIYYSSTTNTCEPCHPNCASCSNGNDTGCLTCSPTAIRKHPDRSCGSTCKDGTFPTPNVSTTCSLCHTECFSCSGPAKN